MTASTAWQVETISSPALTLDILPEMGASILNLRAASGRPVMRPVALENVQTSSQCACFTLLPYSNRIRDAHFAFAGQDVQLRPNTKDGLAQHGDVRNRPWTVMRASSSHLICDFDSRDVTDVNWPWAFSGRVEYRLHGPHLDISVTLTNLDSRPLPAAEMPAGLGLHPYFARLQDGLDPLLTFDGALTYDTDERNLPLGGARPVQPSEDFRTPTAVGTQTIDRVYTAWDGIARLDWQPQAGSDQTLPHRALILTADNVFSHLVVFTAPDGSLALEPVSHATDAFNLAARGIGGTDMKTLLPGQSLAGTLRVTVEGEW
ncbi:aldose 1-epimerase [Deinococcus oregonensis]|uniref:Aldose 1-epimerase n=1 Tax=Deinococcus oregonensis TaxID=1805970 RepID=A0ABV6B1J5_9DEIO